MKVVGPMANVSAALPVDWQAASQLLQVGEYQQAADLLQKAQSNLQTENPLLALLAGSVQQIILACWQCQDDRAWHEQANVAAQSREEILRRQAQSILGGLSAQGSAETTGDHLQPEPPPATPTSAPRPTRWSQMRGLFQQMMQFLGREEEIPAAPPATFMLPEASAAAPPSLAEPPLAAPSPTEPESAAPDLPASPALPPLEAPVVESSEPLLPTPVSEPAPEAPATLVPAEATRPAATPLLPPSHDLVICCLGAFRVYQQDQLIEEWNGLKGQMILKYLAVQRGAPVAKDVLMDIFWPDTEPEAARRNLHQAIYSLRQTLRRRDPTRQHIHFENNQYLLNPALSVWVDSDEFAVQVQTGRRLQAAGELLPAMAAYGQAEALYQGDFLMEDLYEEWPRGQRDRLRSLYLEIADRLSEHHLQQGAYSVASALCHKILTLDNCFEVAHRRLMRCYLAQGQRHLAIRQYHACVQALANELDVPPDDETQALYESITAQPGK
jgi:DNA-binding SARP family transcriptional activator